MVDIHHLFGNRQTVLPLSSFSIKKCQYLGTIFESIKQSKRQANKNPIRQMAEFPLFSESLLSGIQQFGPVAKWLRHQMENFDGTGYPDKLRGEEIPIEHGFFVQ